MPRILAVGPLPPPLNGTSVSFQLFCEEIYRCRAIQSLEIIDSSPRKLKDKSSSKMPLTTLMQAMRIFPQFCWRVRLADQILIFGSNGFILLMAPLLVWVAKLARKPSYIRVFGGSLDTFYMNLNPLFRWLLEATLRDADGFIVQTELLHNFFSALVGDNKVHLVPGYRPMYLEDASPSVPETSSPLRLVFLGHVREEKGIFVLLESLRMLSWKGSESIQCDFFGPIYKSVVTRFEDELALTPNATYKGILSPVDVIPTLRGYDVLVLPSFYQGEGHPGVLIEAMVAGVAVIATEFRSIPELIKDRVNGLLVPPQDPQSLVEAIKMIHNNRRLLADMAKRNWELRTQHDARQVIPLILQPLGVNV